MRDDLPKGRFVLLGKCLTSSALDQGVKSEIITYLFDRLESIVLNDKQQVGAAESNLMYF